MNNLTPFSFHISQNLCSRASSEPIFEMWGSALMAFPFYFAEVEGIKRPI